MTSQPQLGIFVSYTGIDPHGKQFAIELTRILKQANFDVYFFNHSSGSQLGSFLWPTLAQEIEKRGIVIVICTEAINASYGATFEYNLGIHHHKLMIPMRYDGAPVPGALVAHIHLDFDDSNYATKFAALVKELPSSFQKHLENQAFMDRAYQVAK
jgi:hypothetical protein